MIFFEELTYQLHSKFEQVVFQSLKCLYKGKCSQKWIYKNIK